MEPWLVLSNAKLSAWYVSYSALQHDFGPSRKQLVLFTAYIFVLEQRHFDDQSKTFIHACSTQFFTKSL